MGHSARDVTVREEASGSADALTQSRQQESVELDVSKFVAGSSKMHLSDESSSMVDVVSNLSSFRPGSPPPIIHPDPEDVQEEAENAVPETQGPASPRPSIVVTPAADVPPPFQVPHDLAFVDYVPPRPLPPRQHNRSLYSRTMAFFGYGRGASRVRRAQVGLVYNMCWGLIQLVFLTVFLVLSSKLESPTVPGVTEWKACERPLGVWASLWSIRVAVALLLTYWGYERDMAAVRRRDTEPGNDTGNHLNGFNPSADNDALPASANNHRRRNESTLSNDSAESEPVPHSPLYRKLSLFSSLFSLSWFLTAHILEYSSINTCRLSSPHLWWLTFGILCITYLIILEVILLGFVVFIMAPIIFLFWNIFLMCLGRHPLQNPTLIKPEIGKLPKAIVDQIPLVMYIPPPPNSALDGAPIKVPQNAYHYPPKQASSPPTSPVPAKRHRFKFLRFKGKKKTEDKPTEVMNETKEGKKRAKDEPQSWEDHWEQDGYPFVILDGNRAACAICLMDFEEPKRAQRSADPEKSKASRKASSQAIQEVDVEQITEEEEIKQITLQDAGDGAQPLRLLACGHVFHRTCLDPWLTDVSGRCPVCQRPVDIPEPEKKKRFKLGSGQSSNSSLP